MSLQYICDVNAIYVCDVIMPFCVIDNQSARGRTSDSQVFGSISHFFMVDAVVHLKHSKLNQS